MEKITLIQQKHYSNTFELHGATPEGVDWRGEEKAALRYSKVLNVITEEDMISDHQLSILDVGCGYGGLYLFIQESPLKKKMRYAGIDVCGNMIDYAKSNFKGIQFHNIDLFDFSSGEKYDYVVCNGILTQKLSARIKEMDAFSKKVIHKMFSVCNKGVSINFMTSKVNFMVDNLFYKSPLELFGYCLDSVTDKIKIDHSYQLHEYTIYLYK